MTSGKDHFRTASLNEKLFGKLSVSDVARCNDRAYQDNGFGVQGYEIKPNLRFNF